MNRSFGKQRLHALVAIVAGLLLVLPGCIGPFAAAPAKISAFGQYRGYSEAVYSGSQRSSDYLTLSDGTRLAYDLFLPTNNGVPTRERLPVLFKYTPYDRAWTIFARDGANNLADLGVVPWWGDPVLRFKTVIWPNDKIMDALSRTSWLPQMVSSGYAVIVVDRPGTGASFGQLNGDPEVVAHELNDILNWIAVQPWSDGKVGMFGDSIQAQIQFRAASTGNPHLKAILPATTWMDNYSAVVFPGGIPDEAFTNLYVKVNKAFNAMATPVDRDKDGILLAQAEAERKNAVALADAVADLKVAPYRDSPLPTGQKVWTEIQTLYPFLDRINRAGVPVYLINGWYDIYARDNFLIYANLTVPKRLLIRPTDHAGIEAPGSDIDYGAEAHRWFDYWLKGIDNGIMSEPPIHYYLQGVDQTQAWQSAEIWPLKNQVLTKYYFGPGTGDSRVSTNDGALGLVSPVETPAFDRYTVDYTTTTGTMPHWSAVAVAHQYPDLRSRDAKALTYTTPPLDQSTEVAGHPIAHLWLSTDAPDLDVFGYLEQVDRNGNSTYISEGELRTSHRALSPTPFENFGLPWHNHFQTAVQPIPAGVPIEMVFDLLPTAWRFAPGNQIRITVAFADAGNFETPVLNPPPTLNLLRDASHASYVELPVVH
jgi:putative CocE/NonD family hydrolase